MLMFTPSLESAELELTLPSASPEVDLGCTWTTPESGQAWPAVALLTVAGPDDRDQTVGPHRLYADLANGLAAQGIASLRCDDRGVGESTGDSLEASYYLRAQDALEMVSWVRRQKRVDPNRVGLVGNSEGGAVAPLAALQSEGVVSFLVLLAGPGVPAKVALGATLDAAIERMGIADEAAANFREKFRDLLALMELDPEQASTRDAKKKFLQGGGGNLIPPYRFVPRNLEGLTDFLLSPWYRSQYQYVPAETLAQLQVPVLGLYGSKDSVLPPALHMAPMQEALKQNNAAEVHMLDGLNHVFQEAETGLPTEYATLSGGFSPQAIEVVAQFINDLFINGMSGADK